MAERLREHYEWTGGGARPLGEALVGQMLSEFAGRYKTLHPRPVAELDVPRSGKLVVVGDTHGQLADVLLLFKMHGPPTRSNVYLFNGDIADRGTTACEIFLLIISYFLADPASIVINRGNHEDEAMNRQSAYEGGGFFDEVKYKFGTKMYKYFVQVYKSLSLATVIGGKVFVVHGGLSSQRSITLDTINQIPHTSRPLPDTGGVLSACEELWVDLVWSDPCDERGCYHNDRGVGCLFGPDVTREFLQDNSGISLIVRSHELPENNAGFWSQHGNRVVTLFSASNYCGDSGNRAAVMTFTSEAFPQYEVSEYYAPELETIAALAGKGEPPERWIQEGEEAFMEFNSGTKRDEAAKVKELQKVMVAIVENKPDIWAKYLEVTGGHSMVTYSQWQKILSSILVTKWNWKRLWDYWGLGADDSRTNFVDFLRRFTVTLTKEEFLSFTLSAISRVYHMLLEQHNTMEQTLQQFDKDGNGSVDIKELREALQNLDTGLSKAQIGALIRSVYRGKEESIAVNHFFSRMCLVFKHARSNIEAGAAQQHHRLMEEAVEKIAHVIAKCDLGELCRTISPQCEVRLPEDIQRMQTLSIEDGERCRIPSTTLAERFAVVFNTLDVNCSGVIDNKEFALGLWSVDAVRKIKLSSGEMLTEAFLHKMAGWLDKNNSGTISVWEFLSQFEVEEVAAETSDALVENIISLLLRHRSSIRAGLALFDKAGSGCVAKGSFEKVLRALNQAISKTGHHWSASQIGDLCNALVAEEDAGQACSDDAEGNDGPHTCRIDYEAVFDSLQVVDSEFPDMGVRLGRAHKQLH